MGRARPWIEAFAPATVSNLGPGFDCLGLAVRTVGDTVRARVGEQPGVVLSAVEGDGGKLPREIDRNTASVAAAWLLERHAPGQGVELQLTKGLPLGSGLGSSGASACAAAVAVDAALALSLPEAVLVEAARHAEGVACGTPHPDNVAPCVVGGIVLIPALEPLRLISLPVPDDLWLALYTPGCSVATADARAVLPSRVSLPQTVTQAARLGLLVHALHEGDLALLGEAVADDIVEPARAGLIPGYLDAKTACLEAGALACSISGAGPTTFALTDDEGRARALMDILEETYTGAGVPGRGLVDRVGPGARVTSPPLH
ncbi:MAG: homoserine kinase [Deltaproteobacteria bacterium]|nr:homoserine kinase [Deltaproteobacteria bacterium]